MSDSSCVDETAGLVRPPEICDFWGRLKPQVFSLILYNVEFLVDGVDYLRSVLAEGA